MNPTRVPLATAEGGDGSVAWPGAKAGGRFRMQFGRPAIGVMAMMKLGLARQHLRPGPSDVT